MPRASCSTPWRPSCSSCFLRRATGCLWPSAFVAFLFALHPLHVESVAWISERKDVLSALFWFLALWSYVRYVERPGPRRYLAVVAWFVLGLMAKPMIVTLPFLLLLLDFWPLRRPLRAALVREKIPLFALSAAASVATFLVQRHSGAVEALAALPLKLRVENAVVSYWIYIFKTIWPARLAVFYPHPKSIPRWQAILAAAALLAVSWAVVRAWRAAPYLAAGWFWYLGTLLPVIGLVQVGAQARADRYMYVPMIGLAVAFAWGASVLFHRSRVLLAVAAAVLLACLPAARAQAETWQNSETLFRQALAATTDNYLAEHNLGTYLTRVPGRLPEAIAHLEASLRIHPQSARALTDLGTALARAGRLPEALADLQAAVRLSPESAIPHNNLANNLLRMGRLPEAIAEYRVALSLDPDYADARNNLAAALASGDHPGSGAAGSLADYRAAVRFNPDSAAAHLNLAIALAADPAHIADAIPEYEAALRLDPNSAEAHNNLAGILANDPARAPEAIEHYQAALRINPNSAEIHDNFGNALARMGRTAEAIAEYQSALRLRPDYADAHLNLGAALASLPGRLPEAVAHFEAAVRLQPNSPDAQYNLGVALANLGRGPEALQHLEIAYRLKPDPELKQTIDRLRSGGR